MNRLSSRDMEIPQQIAEIHDLQRMNSGEQPTQQKVVVISIGKRTMFRDVSDTRFIPLSMSWRDEAPSAGKTPILLVSRISARRKN